MARHGGGLRRWRRIPASAQELLARQIADMGMSFRMTGDVEERAGRSPPCR
jgi:hypothetical protein